MVRISHYRGRMMMRLNMIILVMVHFDHFGDGDEVFDDILKI